MKCVLTIDQSTQGTKILLVGSNGKILARRTKSHRQLVDSHGYISHDAEEIFQNVLFLVPEVVKAAGIDKRDVAAIGIANQRETTVLFNKDGALAPAIVWQCARGKEVTERLDKEAQEVYRKTGLPLSPYFPAAKMAWLIKHVRPQSPYMLGTIDSWLIYRLTNNFYTDYSNASRTQLFNLDSLTWDEYLCRIFEIPLNVLPTVVDSDGDFGMTDVGGFFDKPVPICAVLGDSHSALYAHGCFEKGSVKATYGTGTSVMMNIGDTYRPSLHKLSVSLAWKIAGKINYVLEGNINYSAAIVSWLQNDLGLVSDLSEVSLAAKKANPKDTTVLVPAFSGLSAPYWKPSIKAMIAGMTRITGKNELIRAALDSIAFQINDVLCAMLTDSGLLVTELFTDGGASNNEYLMQTQSNLGKLDVKVPSDADFSALGVAYLAGKRIDMTRKAEELVIYRNQMNDDERNGKLELWNDALKRAIG